MCVSVAQGLRVACQAAAPALGAASGSRGWRGSVTRSAGAKPYSSFPSIPGPNRLPKLVRDSADFPKICSNARIQMYFFLCFKWESQPVGILTFGLLTLRDMNNLKLIVTDILWDSYEVCLHHNQYEYIHSNISDKWDITISFPQNLDHQ